MHLVGSAHYNVFGSQGSDAHVKIEHHPTLEECRETMKETYNVEEILGVEITEESVDVAKYPWKGNTAFVLGEWKIDVVVAFFLLCLSLSLSLVAAVLFHSSLEFSRLTFSFSTRNENR